MIKADAIKTKTCSACKIEKPLGLFSAFASYADGYRGQCKVCRAAYQKRYKKTEAGSAVAKRAYANYAKKPLLRRNLDLLKNHRISLTDYARLLAIQGEKCAICETADPGWKKHDRNYFVVDHCHATGRLRGLLCVRCNLGLGMLGDTYETLKRATDYLTQEGLSRWLSST